MKDRDEDHTVDDSTGDGQKGHLAAVLMLYEREAGVCPCLRLLYVSAM
jgi:hypothetical protein